MDLPGAVVEDEISDRDSPDAGSLSTPSPPQVAPSLKTDQCYFEQFDFDVELLPWNLFSLY